MRHIYCFFLKIYRLLLQLFEARRNYFLWARHLNFEPCRAAVLFFISFRRLRGVEGYAARQNPLPPPFFFFGRCAPVEDARRLNMAPDRDRCFCFRSSTFRSKTIVRLKLASLSALRPDFRRLKHVVARRQSFGRLPQTGNVCYAGEIKNDTKIMYDLRAQALT